MTCHDGFTLNDLVSYNEKHNEANGEDSRDGCNDNWSWNCGVEGETDDLMINTLRLRQIKNFFTILFFSQGTPMLLMGDPVRRTQKGNNNAYCQNNELSWFDWEGEDSHAEETHFVRGLIRLTQSLAIFQEESVLDVLELESYDWEELDRSEIDVTALKKKYLEMTYSHPNPHITWHGVYFGQPDWSYDSHSLAFTLHHPGAGEQLHVILNAYWRPLLFELPPLGKGKSWYRIIDTSLHSPLDFCEIDVAPIVTTDRYPSQSRSSLIFMAK